MAAAAGGVRWKEGANTLTVRHIHTPNLAYFKAHAAVYVHGEEGCTCVAVFNIFGRLRPPSPPPQKVW